MDCWIFEGAGLADMLVFPTDKLSTKPAPTLFLSIIWVNDIIGAVQQLWLLWSIDLGFDGLPNR